jgi:hypothetical protein
VRVAGCYGQTAGGAWLSECLVSTGTFEANISETGPRVKINRRVKLDHCKINNHGTQFPDVRVLGTDGSVITNDSWQYTTNNGTHFGDVDVSSGVKTHTFTMTNIGTRTLNISGMSTNGGNAADFVITAWPTSVLAVGESGTFSIEFNPSEVGPRKTMMFLSSDDPDDDPYVLWLYGDGVEPEMFVLATNYSVITNGSLTPVLELNTDYGVCDVTDEVVTNTFVITNAGNATLNIAGASVSGWDASVFTVTVPPAASVATGETTSFTIEFDPDITGLMTTMVEVASDAPGSPYTFMIQGLGVEPNMQVLGVNLALIPNGDTTPITADGTDYGVCDSGSITHTFTITNAGSSDLELTNSPFVMIAGAHSNDFTVTVQPSGVISSGTVSSFDIEFFPLSTSTRTAEVRIVSNDSYHTNELYTFEIRGEGSTSNQFIDIDAGLHNVGAAAVAWGDYDNDGWLDLAMLGYDGTNRFTDIYRNNSGTFTNIGAGFTQMESGRIAWGDYDGDGDLDIALAGYAGTQTVTEIYRNDSGVFTNIQAEITGAYNGGLAWGDYDNDGDLDIAVAGFTRSNSVTEIYRNDDGTFVNIGANLKAIRDGRLSWADYDKDGRLDLLVSGDDGTYKITRLYKNYGDGSFTNVSSASLLGVAYGGQSWGDFDGDGDLDLALCGYSDTGMASVVYRYNGGLSPFAKLSGSTIDGVWLGDCEWGDFDNDGDLDLLMAGASTNNTRVARVYQNNSGVLSNMHTMMTGMRVASVAWGDYDNDGDLDIAMAGQTTNGYRSYIYRNLAPDANTPPDAPTGLSAVITNGNQVVLSWNAATDDLTASNSLTYNIYLGTSTNYNEIASGQADLSTGWRRVAQLGNTQLRTSWTLEQLPNKALFWGVQAVDAAYMAGPFAVGPSVTPAAMPDFVVSEIQVETVPFSASVTVSNQGYASGNAGLLSIWLDEPDEVSCGTASERTNSTVGVMAPGEFTTVVFTNFTQPTALVTNIFRAFINSDCSELEETTANNQLTQAYTMYEYDAFWFNAFALTNNVYLRWINPTNCGIQTPWVQVRFSTTDYPATTTDGSQIYLGTNQVYQHTGLTPGQPYYYSIWLSNDDGTNWVDPPVSD